MPDLSALAEHVYPSLEHDEIAAGPYLHELASEGLPPEELADGLGGIDVRWRMVNVRVDDEGDDSVSGKETALRAWRAADGVVRLDRLDIAFVPLMGFRVRPKLGEAFDWTIGSGRREVGWSYGNEARAQWRVYSPINIAPIGLSNTDQDDDGRLKYQMSLLGGIGGDVLARVVGPVGVQLRAEGSGRTARRFASDTANNVRHEVVASAEVGLTWFAERQAWTLGAWGEHLSQWNPRDGDRDLDKQYVGGGLRLAVRLYPMAEEELSPLDLEELFKSMDVPVPQREPEPETPPVAPETDSTESPPEPVPEPAPPVLPPAEDGDEDEPITRPPIGPEP